MLAATSFFSFLRDLIQLALKQFLVTQGQGMELRLAVTIKGQTSKGFVMPGQLQVCSNLEGDASRMLKGTQVHKNGLMRVAC